MFFDKKIDLLEKFSNFAVPKLKSTNIISYLVISEKYVFNSRKKEGDFFQAREV